MGVGAKSTDYWNWCPHRNSVQWFLSSPLSVFGTETVSETIRRKATIGKANGKKVNLKEQLHKDDIF